MHRLKRTRITSAWWRGDFPVFEPCGTDGSDAIGMGVRSVLDTFSTQAMVYRWNHPCRDKDGEEFDIPYQLFPLLDVLLGDASHLPVDDSRV